jgi:hypothetical protein
MQLLHSSKYFSIVERTPERNDFHWDIKLSKFSTVLFWYQVGKNRFFQNLKVEEKINLKLFNIKPDTGLNNASKMQRQG